MRNLLLLSVFLILSLSSCGDVINVGATEGLVRLPTVNNVEVVLDIESINGKTVRVSNANSRAVGVNIKKADDESVVVFSDSWIGGGKTVARSGVHFERGWHLLVTIVVYKDAGGGVNGFIQSLGTDFLDDIQDFHIESQREMTVVIE